jgi:hypothetical protein
MRRDLLEIGAGIDHASIQFTAHKIVRQFPVRVSAIFFLHFLLSCGTSAVSASFVYQYLNPVEHDGLRFLLVFILVFFPVRALLYPIRLLAIRRIVTFSLIGYHNDAPDARH